MTKSRADTGHRFPRGWPNFTDAQRTILASHGLGVEQIDELRLNLRAIEQEVATGFQVTPVRKRLAKMDAALSKVSRLLQELLEPFDTLQNGDPSFERPALGTRAAQEVEIRLLSVSDEPEILGTARRAVEAVRVAVGVARRELPRQRRHHAPWRAVARIDDALVRGFTKHHQEAERRVVLPMSDDDVRPHASLPAYTLRASRSGPFPEIVAACLASVGITTDADRAIRMYVSMKAARESEYRKSLGFGRALSPKPGRRRK